MGLVENDVAMFTMPMESNDTLDDYYGVFKAQVDTIKAHGNNPGYHGVVYHEHYKVITVSKGYDTKEKLDAVEDVDIKRMKSEAMKSSTGAYLGCLFLIMADGRYTPVNKFLHEAFLAEKEQYPRSVLAMKRFMADFIGVDAGKPTVSSSSSCQNWIRSAGLASRSCPLTRSQRGRGLCATHAL